MAHNQANQAAQRVEGEVIHEMALEAEAMDEISRQA